MAWKGHGDAVQFRVYGKFEIAPEGEENIPREGDEGTVISVDMQEDCTGVQNPNFAVKKGDGTVDDWTPTASGNKLEYTTVQGDLVKGNYIIVPYGEFA